MSEFDERSLLAAFVKCGVTDEDEKGSVHQYFKELRVRELVDLLAREPDGVRAHVLGCLSSPNFGAVLKAHERLTRPSPEPERPTDSQTSSETAPTPPRGRRVAPAAPTHCTTAACRNGCRRICRCSISLPSASPVGCARG